MQAKNRVLWATVAVSATLPAFAQDQGGVTSQVVVSPTVEYTDNPGFSGRADDSNYRFQTDVDAVYSTETKGSVLALSLGGRVSAGLNDGDVEFENARLGFDYGVENRSTALSTRYRFRESNVSASELDEDLAEVFVGTGKRQSTDFSASYEGGRDAPVGTSLSYRLQATSFADTSDPDLFDTDLSTVRAEVILRPSARYDVSLGLNLTDYEAEDSVSTERESFGYRLGFNGDLTPTLNLGVGIAYDESDTTTTAGDESFDGFGYDVELTSEQPTSLWTASVNSRIGNTGRRTTLSFGQTLARPVTTLSWSLGGTWSDGSDSFSPVANVAYQQDVSTGSVRVNLEQSVQTSTDSNDAVNSRLSASYLASLDDLSSIQFGVSWNDTNDLEDDANDRTSTSLSVTYRRSLTSDWDAIAGYRYSESQDSDTTEDENVLSFGVTRVFDFRR